MVSVRVNSISRAALMAAMASLSGIMSASAADLGGNCCADLEERVAELEATTARKGNRKVSLQIYGQVSESIMWWNDGAESNVYVQENNLSKNKLGFQGSSKINSDWSAGFNIELQIRAYRSSSANQLSLGASNNMQIPTYNTQSVALRSANWWIRSNTYGMITVGRVNDAAAGAGTINLVNPDGFASNGYGGAYANQGYFLRRAGTTGNTGLSALDWRRSFQHTLSDPVMYDYGGNSSVVKYTSPFFLGQSKSTGFRFETSFGQDDSLAFGLRYAESFGSFRLAAGASYSKWTGPDQLMCSNLSSGNESAVNCEAIQASASVLHAPTGLYVSGGYGQIKDNNRVALANATTAGLGSRINDTDSSWWVQAGWQAKLSTLGSTIFWGQYAEYDSHFRLQGNSVVTLANNDVLNSFGAGNVSIKDSHATSWGFGVTQNIDAAAMALYIGYLSSSADMTLINRATFETRKANPIDDFGVLFTGATIKF